MTQWYSLVNVPKNTAIAGSKLRWSVLRHIARWVALMEKELAALTLLRLMKTVGMHTILVVEATAPQLNFKLV